MSNVVFAGQATAQIVIESASVTLLVGADQRATDGIVSEQDFAVGRLSDGRPGDIVGIGFAEFIADIVIDVAGDLALGIGQRNELTGKRISVGGYARQTVGLGLLATTSVEGVSGRFGLGVGGGDFVSGAVEDTLGLVAAGIGAGGIAAQGIVNAGLANAVGIGNGKLVPGSVIGEDGRFIERIEAAHRPASGVGKCPLRVTQGIDRTGFQDNAVAGEVYGGIVFGAGPSDQGVG